MPVRTVSNRGRRNVIGYFPSLKMRRMVQFESTLERDLIYLLDFVAQVVSFEEQPLVVEYEHQGKTLSYTPDFQVVFASGRMALLECKPQCFVGKEANQRKFQAAEVWCGQRGWFFQVVTEEPLRTGYRLQNVKLLTQHARHEVGTQIKQSILACLSTAGRPRSLTIEEVMVAVRPAEPTAVIVPILQMAYHHELDLPLDDGLLNPQSAIGLGQPGCHRAGIGENDEYRTLFNG